MKTLRMIIAAPISALAMAWTVPALSQVEDPADTSAGDTDAIASMASSMGESMSAAFPEADPLTPDEAARLPAAMALVEQMIPPGAYQQLMDEAMGPMMEGIMGGVSQLPIATLLAAANLDEQEVARLGETTLADIMAVLDPSFDERNTIMTDVMVEMMGRMMTKVEPIYKDGLARAYAARFETSELAEIGAFFDTPVGSKYAGQSILIYADPQVTATMKEVMPAMFDEIPLMMEEMAEKTAHLPSMRGRDDLTSEDRARLAQLLGIDPADLDTSILERMNDT